MNVDAVDAAAIATRGEEAAYAAKRIYSERIDALAYPISTKREVRSKHKAMIEQITRDELQDVGICTKETLSLALSLAAVVASVSNKQALALSNEDVVRAYAISMGLALNYDVGERSDQIAMASFSADVVSDTIIAYVKHQQKHRGTTMCLRHLRHGRLAKNKLIGTRISRGLRR